MAEYTDHGTHRLSGKKAQKRIIKFVLLTGWSKQVQIHVYFCILTELTTVVIVFVMGLFTLTSSWLIFE